MGKNQTESLGIPNNEQAETLKLIIGDLDYDSDKIPWKTKRLCLRNIHENFEDSFMNIGPDWDGLDIYIFPRIGLKVFTTFIIQTGYITHKLCEEINETYQSLYIRTSISPYIRLEALQLISLAYFLSSPINWSELQSSMNHIWNIFRCPMQRDLHIYPDKVEDLQIAAMKCWTLLFSILPSYMLVDVGLPVLSTLTKILKCSKVEYRITAGESIALIYNKIQTETDHEFHKENHLDLIYEMQLLAKDEKKSRNKQNRKIQLSFREILKQVQIGERDFQKIQIPLLNETMEINDWIKKCQYEFLCNILEGGITYHLQWNIHVRYIFNFGLPIDINKSKLLDFRNYRKKCQNLSNKVNTKLRKQARQQNQ